MTDDATLRAVLDGFRRISERCDELEYHVAEHHRRMANMIRPGTLISYDPQKALGIADVGFETRPLRWMEHAGAMKSWHPPTQGQQIMLFSPNGEPGQGLLMPYGYSQANPAPSQDPQENVIAERGQVRLSLQDDRFVFKVGNQSATLDPDGFKLNAKTFAGTKAT